MPAANSIIDYLPYINSPMYTSGSPDTQTTHQQLLEPVVVFPRSDHRLANHHNKFIISFEEIRQSRTTPLSVFVPV